MLPVSSARGAAARDGSKGVFASHVILDDCRSRKQAAGVPGLFQRLSHASLIGGADTRPERTTIGCESGVLSMAIALSRLVSDTECCPDSRLFLAVVRRELRKATRPETLST